MGHGQTGPVIDQSVLDRGPDVGSKIDALKSCWSVSTTRVTGQLADGRTVKVDAGAGEAASAGARPYKPVSAVPAVEIP